MLDLFYSSLLLSLVLLWVMSSRMNRFGKVLSYLRRHTNAFSVVLWAIFVAFAVSYVLFFSQLAQMHDIPNAVNSAVASVDNGMNPYDQNIVPRFEDKYSPNPHWSFGTYNYLSLDLMVYVGFHSMFAFLGLPLWFVATNILFSGIAMYLLRELLQVSWKYYAPIAGTVMLFYSFDNTSLTILLIVFSLYLYHNLSPNQEALATVVMGLAVMTKVYAIVPFAVLVLYQLQGWSRLRDWKSVARVSAGVATSGAIAFGLMLPFGVKDVLNAAVLFHANVSSRIGTASGGTLLTQISMSGPEFTLVSALIVLIALFASLRIRSLNARMLVVSFAFLLVVVKSSLALLVLPGIFLPLLMKEISLRLPSTKQRPASELANT